MSNDPGNSTAPVVAAVGSHVYVAWEDKPDSSTHIQTYFTASSDYGATWSAIIAFTGLSGGANPQTDAVQIAAEGQYVFLTWEQGGQTAYAISSDYGASFQYNIFSVTGTLAGIMSGQAVTANGSYAYFTWADQPSTSRTKSILFVQAHDSGSGVFTFTSPVKISGTTSTSGEDESASVGNYVYVVWDSIYITVSSNNGQTFSTPKQIRASGGSGGSLSREPMVAACGTNVYVTFPSDSTPDGSYQAFVVVSNNNGATFASAKDLSFGSLSNVREVQVACNGNDAYITSRGKSATVSGTQQYVYVSQNNGATFTLPTLLGPKLPNPENGFGGLAVDGNNVYVQWVHNNETQGVQQIYFAASQDNGATWAPNQKLSNSAAGTVGYGDPNGSQGPMVSASLGHVYAVWQDNSTGNGDIYFLSS